MKSLSARASAELSAYDAIFITGGSSGIGEAFLRDALSCGSSRVFNISRTPPAQSLQSLRKFSHITCDLTDEASILSLFVRLKLEFESLDKFCLDNFARPPRVLLVNNAGFGLYGPFPEPNIGRNTDMISLNVSALTRLCAEFLPIVKRGKGSIINISSVAAFEPCPVLAVYAATKAYVKSFSLSLSYELGKFGCKCLCVCPGPTSSNFYKAAGFDEPPLSCGLWNVPEYISHAAYAALAKGKVLLVVGFQNRLLEFLSRILPTRFMLTCSGMILERVRGGRKSK